MFEIAAELTARAGRMKAGPLLVLGGEISDKPVAVDGKVKASRCSR